jgi:ComF family protein
MWKDFVNLLFPEVCVTCQTLLVEGERHLCLSCSTKLPIISADCSEGYQDLLQRFWGRVPLSHALPFLHMTRKGSVQKIIHQIKYKGNKDLAFTLGSWAGGTFSETYANQFDQLIPVPLHPQKLKLRGYNQSEEFAKGISLIWSCPLSITAVERVHFTETQTKKSKYDRWLNVEEVFRVANPGEVQNQRILLIDDVITTGATLEACAEQLLQAGAKSVGVGSIALAAKN